MNYGREAWMVDHDPDRMEEVRRHVVDHSFWAYVDTQGVGVAPNEGGACCENRWTGLGAHRLDCDYWPHVRGNDQCIAANGNRAQCRQDPLPGVPFCGFHMDRAWLAMLAFVENERGEAAISGAAFDRRLTLEYLGVEEAQVRDAKRLLQAQPERVYFFAADGFVKIGRSVHPERRVRSLSGTLAPEGVNTATGTLLGTVVGGCEVESHLHRRFLAYRTVGEWFHLEPIRAEVESLIARDADEMANTA